MSRCVVDDSRYEIKESNKFIVFVWIICRVIGLVPLKIRTYRENGRTVWMASYSKGWAVYSWGFLVFTVCTSLCGFFTITGAEEKQLTKFLYFTLIFNVAAMIFTAFVGVSRSGIHTKNLVKARKLMEKAQLLSSCTKSTNKSSKFYNKISLFCLFVWICILTVGFISQFVGQAGTRRPLLHSWYFATANTIKYFIVLNFANVVNSMMHTTVQVNETLNQIQKDLNNKLGVYEDLKTKLSAVIEARSLVCKAGIILRRDQSPVVLVTLLSIISRSVVVCNNAIFETRFPGREFFASFLIACCFGEAVKLIVIVESCHYFDKIANQTKDDITRLLMTIREFGLRSDLKYCLRQINDQPVSFTAMDVWIIDRELIGTVFGLVLTNLIVIVQFAN